MQTSNTIGAIAAAISKAQGEFSNPHKNREVSVQSDKGSYKFSYATFDNIIDTVRPVLSRHEIAFIQTVSGGENGAVTVTTRLAHASGEWIEDSISGRSERPGLQAQGSALTYLKRYSLTAILGLATDEDDDGNAADGNHIEKSSGRQPKPAAQTPFDGPIANQRDDMMEWLHVLKKDIDLAPTYVSAAEIWQAGASTLKAMRRDFPEMFADLVAWKDKAIADKPKEAA